MGSSGNRRAFFKAVAGDRRAFLKTAAAGAAVALSSNAQSQSRPLNIVLIVADDLGYGDLSCYGSVISTPNLDQMAQDGMRFTHFYAGGPTCSPSRAALMTGRYPVRVGIPRVLDPGDNNGMPASETTIAQMLKPAGYATMHVGKWHLGSQPQFLPTNHGFDHFYGIPYSIDMSPRPLMQDLNVIEQPANLDNLTQRYTQQAVNFINQSKNGPFFLYMAHSFPHIPLAASASFIGGSYQGLYGDVVQEIDASVGTVLQALKDNGIDSNTLVMFSSDHGPWYQGSTGPLRMRKGEIFEGGMRVPFIARLPGVIPNAWVCAGLATNMDVLPTVANLTGAALPPNPLDGIDISPLLTGQQKSLTREAFLFFNDVCLQAARIGPWKLHTSRFNIPAFTPQPVGGRVNLPLPSPELYNVVSDPDESHDRAARNHDVVSDLQGRMARLIQTFSSDAINSWNDTLNRKVGPTPVGAWPVQIT
jgi:arylsulfatase